MNNTQSLIFYLLTFFAAALLMYFAKKRNSKILLLLSLIIPILVASFRYEVGTDYPAYVSLYNSLSILPFSEFTNGNLYDIETGFYLLIKLSQFITGNYLLLFAMSSFLTIGFFYLGLRKYKLEHTALFYLLYLLIIFPVTFNAVRQGISMSICFYALSFVIEKRLIKYVLLVFFASLFHASALFMLPIYGVVLLVKKYKRNSYFIFLLKLAILFIAISLLLPFIFELLAYTPLSDKYSKYQTLIFEGNNYTMYVQSILLLIVIALSKWTMLDDKNSKSYYLLAFAVLEIIFITLGFTSMSLKRISLYFSFFSLILLTNVVDIFDDRAGKVLMYILVISYGFIYFYLSFYALGQADIVPYQLITGADL